MTSLDDLVASGVIQVISEVTATLDGNVLASVPISQGDVRESATGPALGSLSITVPATREWIPSSPSHPLAAYGQELIVRRGFVAPSGMAIGWETLGRFVIDSTPAPASGWLEVDATSVDVRLARVRWVVGTRTSGSLRAQIMQICAGVLPVRCAFLDRSIPDRTWEQQDSRRESLIELCDANGLVPRIHDGQLTIVPASTSVSPVRVVQGGPGGTLVSIAPVADGDPSPNAVVASTAPTDSTAPVSAMATTTSGPRRWGGPYGSIPDFFESPLLTTYQQCASAALTRLQRLSAVAPDVTMRVVTDPRHRLDTVLRVIDEDTDCVVRVTQATHALTPGREPGSLSAMVLSGRVKGAVW